MDFPNPKKGSKFNLHPNPKKTATSAPTPVLFKQGHWSKGGVGSLKVCTKKTQRIVLKFTVHGIRTRIQERRNFFRRLSRKRFDEFPPRFHTVKNLNCDS